MSGRHNILRFGEPDDVATMVDECVLNEGEVRAVILNLLERVERLTNTADKAQARLDQLLGESSR